MRLGIWLVRKPEHVLGFFASVTDSQLPELMVRLRELHLSGVIQNPIHLLDKLVGRPSDNAVRSVCARVVGNDAWDETRAADLRDFNVGLYWVTHLCPLTRESIVDCLGLVSTVLKRWSIAPHLTLTIINSRTALCNVTLYYDRTCDRVSLAADECRTELTAKLIAAGYPPYRLGIHSMESVNPIGANHAMLLRKLKSTLDPQAILAPGRYIP